MNRPSKIELASAAFAVAAFALAPASAPASFPGRNGALTFTSDRSHSSYDLYVVRPNGRSLKRLTRTRTSNESQPAWSANGRELAFVRRDWRDQLHPGPFEIWTMNADGSHQRRLARGTEPAWSPNGRRTAFVGPRVPRVGKPDIWVMNADGTHKVRLTPRPPQRAQPGLVSGWPLDRLRHRPRAQPRHLGDAAGRDRWEAVDRARPVRRSAELVPRRQADRLHQPHRLRELLPLDDARRRL